MASGGVDIARVQLRTVRLLMVIEVISGLGVALGFSVGALLTADMAGTALSGAAQSGAIVGGALMAVPATAIMSRYGRRPGMTLCYLIGALGAAAVVASAVWASVPLLFIGFFLFGAGNTAKLQSRYAAVDLADPARRGRQLSLVVWSTTIGAIVGPNLAGPLGLSVDTFGVPALAGPFVFACLSFLVSALLLTLLLRPDPLLLAQRLAVPTPVAAAVAPAAPPALEATSRGLEAQVKPLEATSGGFEASASPEATSGDVTSKRNGVSASELRLSDAWRAVTASPAARLGIAATAVGHLVMVGVMAMTPVHIGQTHSAPDTLRIVGFVLSAHIAGMYGLSPVMGWLTDRLGRRNTILTGVGLLLAACAVAGTAGHDTARLTLGLTLLGLGWSATMIAGSTLLTESVPVVVKARAQGLADLTTGLSGALAGLLSGVVVELFGYGTLSLLAALATVPLIALALRQGPPRVTGWADATD
jgi:MFS family permease